MIFWKFLLTTSRVVSRAVNFFEIFYKFWILLQVFPFRYGCTSIKSWNDRRYKAIGWYSYF